MDVENLRILFVVGCLAMSACKDREIVGGRTLPNEQAPAEPTEVLPVAGADAPVVGAPVAATSLVSDAIFADHVLILPKGSDAAAARRVLDEALAKRSIAIVSEMPESAPEKVIAVIEPRTVAELDISPESLAYFGRGLDAKDLAALGEAKDAMLVSIIGPPAQVADVHHVAAAVMLEVGKPLRAWIVDSWPGETFTVDAFAAARPPDFPLDVRALVRLHVVREEGSNVFLETRGLTRFGLPELFLRGVPHSFASNVGELVIAASQTLVERGALQRDGALVVEHATLRTPGWPETAQAITKARGTGTITFDAIWSHGDVPDGPDAPMLVELKLPGTGDVAARAYSAYLVLSDDPEAGASAAAEDDAELNAARDRARVAFAELAPRFAKGIPELETLSVKAPFHTNEGGIEWMWVELESCKADALVGILLNEPFSPAPVKAGDRVEVKASEIFDYKYRGADGKQQGGTTDEILSRRSPL